MWLAQRAIAVGACSCHTFCFVCRCTILQVFRTYNASITLDKLLYEMEEGGGVGHHGEPYCSRSLEAKKADYDRANKEVSVCGQLLVVALGQHKPCCKAMHDWL